MGRMIYKKREYGGQSQEFQGATSSADGISGAVPAPSAGDEGKYLKGDGNWEDIPEFQGALPFGDGEAGLVPAPKAGNLNHVLLGSGEWGEVPMTSSYDSATGTLKLTTAKATYDSSTGTLKLDI